MQLAEYLKDNGIKRNQFAERIGVTPSMITEYCEGRMWPGRDKMEAIVRETQGQVTPNDFLGERNAPSEPERATP